MALQLAGLADARKQASKKAMEKVVAKETKKAERESTVSQLVVDNSETNDNNNNSLASPKTRNKKPKEPSAKASGEPSVSMEQLTTLISNNKETFMARTGRGVRYFNVLIPVGSTKDIIQGKLPLNTDSHFIDILAKSSDFTVLKRGQRSTPSVVRFNSCKHEVAIPESYCTTSSIKCPICDFDNLYPKAVKWIATKQNYKLIAKSPKTGKIRVQHTFCGGYQDLNVWDLGYFAECSCKLEAPAKPYLHPTEIIASKISKMIGKKVILLTSDYKTAKVYLFKIAGTNDIYTITKEELKQKEIFKMRKVEIV